MPKLDGSVGSVAAKVELVITIGAKVTSRLAEGTLAVSIVIPMVLDHHIKLRFVLLESRGKESEKRFPLVVTIVVKPSGVNVDV
jgi:hypothetical protein